MKIGDTLSIDIPCPKCGVMLAVDFDVKVAGLSILLTIKNPVSCPICGMDYTQLGTNAGDDHCAACKRIGDNQYFDLNYGEVNMCDTCDFRKDGHND